MADSIDQVAQAIDPANFPRYRMMSRIAITVEGNSKRETPVLTGALRRSETHRVERTGERGVVGTNMVYAPPVHRNNPFFDRGLALSRDTINAELEAAGMQFFSGAVQ